MNLGSVVASYLKMIKGDMESLDDPIGHGECVDLIVKHQDKQFLRWLAQHEFESVDEFYTLVANRTSKHWVHFNLHPGYYNV